MLSKSGIEIESFSFEGRFNEPLKYDCHCTSLGKVKHGFRFIDRLKRLLAIIKAIPTVRRGMRSADYIYVFGVDMLFLCFLSSLGRKRKPGIVLDICDIVGDMVGSSLKARLLRLFERIMIRKIHLLVVTSQAFVTEYYEKIQGLRKLRYIVVENKLTKETCKPLPLDPDNDIQHGLRIGYFGMIRCQRSIDILNMVAKKGNGKASVYIRGVALDSKVGDLANDTRDNPWIEFAGPYLSPKDLPQLYQKVDIVWVCYPYKTKKTGNWRWAKTNRFYESCYYKKPMIALSGTQDGNIVADKELGICFDLSDVDSCAEQILNISQDNLKAWRSNIEHLPESVYLSCDEGQRILDALSKTA
jgi:succinoglycan biosynthesis protein ExoL